MMKYFPKFTPKIKEIVRVEHQKGQIENTVNEFARKMKQELLKHLDRPGWKQESISYLLSRLYEETLEVISAINDNLDRDEVSKECADVGNFAMMIADVYRQKGESGKEKGE